MTEESREELRRLVAALEEHLEAVATRRSDTDATVDDAYEAVAVAFERYEEALDTAYAETLPIVLDDSDDDDVDDVDDEDDADADDVDGADDAVAYDVDEQLDPHANDDDDDLDEDIEEFDLR